MTRKIVADFELTGLDIKNDRIIEFAFLEMIDGKLTDEKLVSLTHPEMAIPDNKAATIHKITDEMLEAAPIFKDKAQEIQDFVGDSQIVVTCWTMMKQGSDEVFTATLENPTEPKDNYTADFAFLNKEMQNAGFSTFKEKQQLNTRRWAEVLFGHKQSSMRFLIPHFGFKPEDFGDAHRAERDALLLATIYPLLKKEHDVFVESNKAVKNKPKINKPNL